jgi:hypothetical protein
MIRFESVIAALILVAAFAFDGATGDAGPARNGNDAPIVGNLVMSDVALQNGGHNGTVVK